MGQEGMDFRKEGIVGKQMGMPNKAYASECGLSETKTLLKQEYEELAEKMADAICSGWDPFQQNEILIIIRNIVVNNRKAMISGAQNRVSEAEESYRYLAKSLEEL